MAFDHLSCEQLAYWLEMKPGDINIIDIRDRVSYDHGHIKGAVHLDNSNVQEYIMQTDKERPLVVCCYHGNSSQSAADYMSEQGFQETYSLDGGFEVWKSSPFHKA